MHNLLAGIVGQQILVIGDMMLDHYILGDTHRISPEAPVPVIEVREDTYRAGGAANVAHNLRALQAEVELCGWVGKDESGARLLGLFLQAGVAFDKAFVKAEVPTILKQRVMVRNQQLCRLDREALPAAYNMEAPDILQLLTHKLKGVKAVILSDYAKGVLSQPMADALLKGARQVGCLVAHDPKPRRNFLLKGVDLLTPNRAESLQMAGINLTAGEGYPAEEVCRVIWERYQPHYLVITLGAEGMLLCTEGKFLKTLPTYARAVYDVSGAGDTVVATLTAALAAGACLEEAAHLANTAAGVVVGKVGTATATPEEILNYYL